MSDTTNSCKEEDKTRLECIQLLSTVPDAALPEIAEFLKDCIEFWNWKAQYVSPPETEAKIVAVTLNPSTVRPEFVVDIELTERVIRPDFPFPKEGEET